MRVTPKSGLRENQYVLVITDYFIRHITVIDLPNYAAETTAQILSNEYFCKYSIPSTIISDQGLHFQNQPMQNIQKVNRIQLHTYIVRPHHLQTKGVVKRSNNTFIPQISKVQDTEHNNWDEYLQAIVLAYNSGIYKTTKYSPCEVLYGYPTRPPMGTRLSYFSFSKCNDYFVQLQKHCAFITKKQNIKFYINSRRINFVIVKIVRIHIANSVIKY